MRLLIALLAGGLAGAGLVVSDMTNAARIQSWLDVFGAWDPTLAFVFAGGLIPMFIAWRIAKRHETALTGDTMPAPADPKVDGRLIFGAALFGIGWALVGLCPGPAAAVLSFGGGNAWLFFAAMAVGIVVVGGLRHIRNGGPA